MLCIRYLCGFARVSLMLLSFLYPYSLMKHLRKERKLTIAKVSPGVYHINKKKFIAQIIVTKELFPDASTKEKEKWHSIQFRIIIQ